MKPLPCFRPYAALVGVALATAVSAAPEQWLQYHISDEGRSYRWLELTTNAPADVALPKLTGPPYFARWNTPLDPSGGRWICCDRSRKAGPWNRVFVDTNGNGRLDDDPPSEPVSPSEAFPEFAPIKCVFKGEDGPLTYHLLLRIMNYDNQEVRILAESGCYYDGKVDLGGKKRTLTLIDGNVNGLFNDIELNSTDCDRIGTDTNRANERFLGRLLELDQQLYRIEVARDGAFLKIQKAEGVAFGQVRVPESVSEFTAVGASGHFVRKPERGALTLPVGSYRVHGWVIQRKDAQGAAWKLTGLGPTGHGTFEVTDGPTVKVEVGEPIRPALTIVETKTGADFSLRLKGRLGETLDLEKGGQQPRAPQLVLTGTTGDFRATHTFEYG